jgi:alkanesulfonate monooxygenase SsuD/methylene tetrahydromethanopterin reductase-like flavin-dependent oxidoreductase (luciferase family)
VSSPFAAGSISLRLYPHNDLPAQEIVGQLTGQAALAAAHGFDGIMTAEHHGGFAGYLPNPLQTVAFCLEEMATGWAAPSPLLLPLRPPAMVAEEIAWLNARFPGRVGVGVAAGALPDDFDIMHVPMDGLTARFRDGFEELAGMLNGTDPRGLAGDPAIKDCVERPIPMLSAAMGVTAVKRAARLGAGILFDSLSSVERCGDLVDAYREAGGTGPAVMIRRAWVGEAPREQFEQQLAIYKGYAQSADKGNWSLKEMLSSDAGAVVDGIVGAAKQANVDALNLRVHVPGVTPEQAREQIVALGDLVLPALRAELGYPQPV